MTDYTKLMQVAKEKYVHRDPRKGFGQPQKTPKISEQTLAEIIPSPGDQPSVARDELERYFSQPSHRKNLNDPFSFESYLLAELRLQDRDFTNEWGYFEPMPIAMHDTIDSGNPFLFRGTRCMLIEQILKNGEIKPLDTDPTQCIEAYTGDSFISSGTTGYNGVSTTKDFKIATTYAMSVPPTGGMYMAPPEPGFVLVYDQVGMARDKIIGIDVNKTLTMRGKSASGKCEVKFPLPLIPPKYLVGAIKVTELPATFYPNQSYTGAITTDQSALCALLQTSCATTSSTFTNLEISITNCEAKQKLIDITALIENTTRNHKWFLGIGGSKSKILLDGQLHMVPAGIFHIYTIITTSGKNTDQQKLQQIYEIANKRQSQHTCLFGFGERQALTRYIYDQIADIVRSPAPGLSTPSKPNHLFL
jgi:hypothetical protein